MTRIYSLRDPKTGKEVMKARLSIDSLRVVERVYDAMPCVYSSGMWFGLDEIRAMRRARQGR
ncbi:MAG: hypothetical protein M0R22_13230 [Dehalococcoidia bacterium]|nr:hypothetical protein [Dehalococcoidia bacterium]